MSFFFTVDWTRPETFVAEFYYIGLTIYKWSAPANKLFFMKNENVEYHPS